MKKTFTKLFAALALLVFMTPSLVGWGQTYTTVATFESSSVVTTSSYAHYENDDWDLSFGGNNVSVGTNKTATNIGNCVISQNYGTSANTSNTAVSMLSKQKLNNVSRIQFTYNGGSGNSGNIYLAYKTDNTWNAITLTSGSQGSNATTNMTFQFDEISSAYYVVILDKGSTATGAWRWDNVTITFDKVNSGPATPTHSLTFSANPAAGGNLTVNGSTTSPITVEEGATINISASPNGNYVFSNWGLISGNGSSFGNTSNASTTFTMGTTDAVIVANFSEPQTYTVTYHANVTGIDNQTVNVNQGANHAVKPANTFANAGYGFTQWTTEQDGSGTAYYQGVTITDIQDDLDLWAQWEEVDYDFRNIDGFNSWGSYSSQTVNYSDATVYFNSVSHQGAGNAITDQPVTKGDYFTLKLTEQGATMSSAKFYFTQWTTKTQTITLSYSTDGGTTYSATTPATTSNNFVISNDNLPTGTNAVKITFSNTSNQIGIAGAKITKIASTNPSLTAEDVDLEYDDEEGLISYTLTNPKTGGAVTVATTSDWLSVGNPSNSNESGTVALTCAANTGAERTATVTLTYTYNAKETIEEEVTVTQAVNPNYVPSISEVRAQGTGSVTTKGIVTSVNGKTAYIQDSGAAIVVYNKDNALSCNVGDEIKVSGTLSTFSGLLEITGATINETISTGNTVTPEVMTIAQVNASTKQGWLVKIEEATVSEINGQNVTIAQSNNTIVVRFNSTSDITFEQNNVITLTGNIGCFTNVQIANPTDITVHVVTTPTINVTPASLTGFTYVVDDGPSTTKTVSVSGANLTANITLSLGDNSDFEMSTTEGSGYTNSLTLTQSEGSVAATTVYVRLKAGLALGDSYSGTITLSSTDAANKTVSLSGSVTEPVVDYADLTTGPFKYTGNGTGTLPAGLSTTGTGTYSSQPQIKFDSTDDNVILKTGSAPGAIVFDIAGKFSSGTWTGTFDLQTSEDGTNYSNLAEFTSLSGETQTVFFTNTNPSVRYIKWVFTSKTSGYNVAIGNIIVTAEQSITNGTSTFTPEANHVYVVNNGSTLILDGDYSESLTDATKLIIEDGGQLITHNAVAATVKKEVSAATNWGTATPDDADAWYFIASPVNNASFNTAITSGDNNDYDLYMLDWATSQWLNKKNNDNAELFANGFQRGTGYLYASEAGNTLSVAGEIQPLSGSDNATITLAVDGWNLIGNPLTCKVTVDKAFSELNNGSSVENRSAGSAINPYQGIAVYGEADDVVTFTKAATQNAAAPSNTAALQMTLAKNVTSRGTVSTKVVDNAVVNFNSESSLPKFTMLEGCAKLYFPMEDADYAIVSSDGHGTMPVNFKAKEMGRYTISVETEGIDMSYLHLIDRLTGEDVNLLLDNEYSFIASNNDSEERFILSFTEKGYDAHGNEIFVYQSGNDLIVNGEGELQIFDVMGRMVKNTVINGVEAIAMPQGVYIFRLNENIQKIVVR